jgi:hypothetical protein
VVEFVAGPVNLGAETGRARLDLGGIQRVKGTSPNAASSAATI